MRIKMLKTANGSDDGIHVKGYEKGQTYDVGKDLAEAFVEEMEVAERVKEKKDAGQSTENKDAGGSPENKRKK